MNNRIRLGGALAAIAVVVVLGVLLIPRPTSSGVTQTPKPSTTASPSPASIPTSAVSPGVIPPGRLCTGTDCVSGTLEAGTYSFDAGFSTPANLSFTVPAGWLTDAGFVGKNIQIGSVTLDPAPNQLFLGTFFVTDVFTDACHWSSTMVSAGTTVDQLTNLLATQKGRVATTPTSITVGGFPAKQIELTVPASSDTSSCDRGLLDFWPDPGGDSMGGLCCAGPGSTDVVDAIDVAGRTFVVVARHGPAATPADLAELNAVLASIKIAGSPASPGPSGASPSP